MRPHPESAVLALVLPFVGVVGLAVFTGPAQAGPRGTVEICHISPDKLGKFRTLTVSGATRLKCVSIIS